MTTETAWNEFIDKYYATVLGVCRWYAPRPDWAVDMTQQTFLEFFAKKDRFVKDDHETYDYAPLLLDMARKIAMRSRREAQKDAGEHIRKVGETLHQLEKARPAPDDLARLEEKLDDLEECLQTLSPKSRHLIDSYYFSGISVKRLAVQLSATEKAVYKAIFQVRLKLRECIERKQREDDDPRL